MQKPNGKPEKAREGFPGHLSRPDSRKFGNDGYHDSESRPPRRSQQTCDPQATDSSAKQTVYKTEEAASLEGKDESIPEDFAWMNPNEYRAAVLAQQRMDKEQSKCNKDARQNLLKSEENLPSTVLQLLGAEVIHKERISHSLKSGGAFPREVPRSPPRSRKDVFDEDKGRKARPRVTSVSQQTEESNFFPQEVPWKTGGKQEAGKASKQAPQDEEEKKKCVAMSPQVYNWRTASTNPSVMGLSLEQQQRHGAVAVEGPGGNGNHPSYNSATASTHQTERGPNDVLLSAVLVPDEAQHPTTADNPGGGILYGCRSNCCPLQEMA